MCLSCFAQLHPQCRQYLEGPGVAASETPLAGSVCFEGRESEVYRPAPLAPSLRRHIVRFEVPKVVSIANEVEGFEVVNIVRRLKDEIDAESLRPRGQSTRRVFEERLGELPATSRGGPASPRPAPQLVSGPRARAKSSPRRLRLAEGAGER